MQAWHGGFVTWYVKYSIITRQIPVRMMSPFVISADHVVIRSFLTRNPVGST